MDGGLIYRGRACYSEGEENVAEREAGLAVEVELTVRYAETDQMGLCIINYLICSKQRGPDCLAAGLDIFAVGVEDLPLVGLRMPSICGRLVMRT